ncbi:MAG: histidine--tRNA ligase [Candidatus Acidiferrales bacterium]
MSEAAKPESERREFRAIKGTRDILPPDTALWNWFEKTARSVMESYNFAEIRTPIFEETELFARAVGVETDVVNKEMYSLAQSNVLDLCIARDAIVHFQLSDVKEELVSFFRLGERLEGHAVNGGVPLTSSNAEIYQKLHGRLNTLVDLLNKNHIDAAQTQAKEIQNLVRCFDVVDSSAPGGAKAGGQSGGNQNVTRSFEIGGGLTLRPEATASVCRAYIEHGMRTLPGNQKLYYIGPMFRRERPQKGRYRQFYQIGAEVLGTSDAPAIDAELIEMLTDLLDRCEIDKYTLLINSIGCANTKEACRPKYVELLRAELRKPEIFSKLGADSQRRVETNPLRVMDSKLPEEQAIIEKLPKISEHLCAECQAHYDKLKRELALREVGFTESPRLVRGLDYYMRTTFEITSPILGAQNALCGGGRYDGLVEMLGGPKGIKGIGFALGEDRFIDAIQEARLGEQAEKIHAEASLDIFIAWMGEKAYPTAVRLAHVLRGEKHAVELPPEEMKFRKALERADKLGARFVLIIGEDEIASDTITIKRLADGEQEKISEEALVDYFRPK